MTNAIVTGDRTFESLVMLRTNRYIVFSWYVVVLIISLAIFHDLLPHQPMKAIVISNQFRHIS